MKKWRKLADCPSPSVGNNKMLSILGYLCQINWYRDGIAYLFRNRTRHCSYIKRIDSAKQSVGGTYLLSPLPYISIH